MSIHEAIIDCVKGAIDEAKSQNTYPCEWPPIISPNQLAKILDISRPKVDELMSRSDFPTVYITDSYKRVGALALWNWLNSENGEY